MQLINAEVDLIMIKSVKI